MISGILVANRHFLKSGADEPEQVAAVGGFDI